MRGHAPGVLFAVGLLACVGSSGARAEAGVARAKGHCIFDHSTLRSSQGVCRPHALHYPSDVTGVARRAVYDSALLFGIPYPVLLAIAQCESGLNPRAMNGQHYGLFQFLPATFKGGARKIRQEVGVQVRTYWSAYDSASVAGYLFAVGQSRRWSCETDARLASAVSLSSPAHGDPDVAGP